MTEPGKYGHKKV